MHTVRPKRRPRPCIEPMEPRDMPAGLDLAGLAAAAESSPVLATARTAVLAYHVGQLAYTGHTSLLFGAVQVSQPFALKNLGTGHPAHVAPLAIRSTLPASPSALAPERDGSVHGDGHSASHEHSDGHGRPPADHGHHRGRGHGATEHEE